MERDVERGANAESAQRREDLWIREGCDPNEEVVMLVAETTIAVETWMSEVNLQLDHHKTEFSCWSATASDPASG